MDPDTLRMLLSPMGQDALEAAKELEPRENDFLAHFSTLSQRYPPDLARAALEIVILRGEAVRKFPFSEKLYLTRETLEQASSYEISLYRSERYQRSSLVGDLGCSIGADTLALAQVAPTFAIDRDPLRLLLANANLQALNLRGKVVLLQADLTSPLPLSSRGKRNSTLALFFDPSRRSAGRRTFTVHQYQPPLSVIKDWLPRIPDLGVKISPGVDWDELSGYDAEVEFISLRGELKEAVLWFGSFKTTPRRATLLPGRHTLTDTHDSHISMIDRPLSEPLIFLYEPDPAILRAGLVQHLAAQLNAAQLDPDIAYLTSNTYIPTPFARGWRVVDWLPFNLKRLRAYLHGRGVGHVVIKKRGSPLDPVDLIHKLRLQGDQERVIFLTHLRGEPIVVIASEI